MQRRDFLRHVSMACAVAVAGDSTETWAAVLTREPAESSGGRALTLTQTQMRLVSAVAEGILPATDTPGAVGVGVPDFISLLFSEWLTPQEQLEFQNGLDQLDEECMKQHARSFVTCSSEQQLAMLDRWDREAAAARRAHTAPTFFGRFKSLTVVGYYTSEIAQNEELKIQFGAGQDTPEGPIVVPPPFPL